MLNIDLVMYIVYMYIFAHILNNLLQNFEIPIWRSNLELRMLHPRTFGRKSRDQQIPRDGSRAMVSHNVRSDPRNVCARAITDQSIFVIDDSLIRRGTSGEIMASDRL